jgi:hypothetical protein
MERAVLLRSVARSTPSAAQIAKISPPAPSAGELSGRRPPDGRVFEAAYNVARGCAGGEYQDDEQGEYDTEGKQLPEVQPKPARPLGEYRLERGPAVLASYCKSAEDQGYRGSQVGEAGGQVGDQVLGVEELELLPLELSVFVGYILLGLVDPV